MFLSEATLTYANHMKFTVNVQYMLYSIFGMRLLCFMFDHLARLVRTDGNAKLVLDEGVVYQVSNVFERLPVVFTDAETRMQLGTQTRITWHLSQLIAYQVFLTSYRGWTDQSASWTSALERLSRPAAPKGSGQTLHNILHYLSFNFFPLAVIWIETFEQTHPCSISHPG